MGIYQENNIPQSGKFLAGHQTIEEVWGILFPENELVFSWRQIRFLAFGKNASFHRKRRNNADADTDKSAEEKENLYKTYYIPKS